MTACIVTSSALIVAVIALRFLFRRKISLRIQYALWGLVLLRLLLPFPLLGSRWSVMNAFEGGNSPAVFSLGYDSSALPDLAIAEPGPEGTESEYEAAKADYAQETAEARTAAGTPSTARAGAVVWLLGSLAAGLFLAGTNLTFYRRLKKTRKPYAPAGCRLPVYVTDSIASPCLFGLLRPAVYLTPKAAADNSVSRYVLAHELCHFRHGDQIWSALRGVCLVVYWWNPLVWAAAVLSREDSELACDEAVLAGLGAEHRFEYGRALLDMVAVRGAASGLMCAATTMASGKRGIRERLNHILKQPRTAVPALAVLLLIAAVCVGVTFTGAQNGKTDSSGTEAIALDAQELYDCRNPYVGDASADGKLLRALGISQSLGAYTIELETAQEPYVLRVIFSDTLPDGAAAFNRQMRKNAALLLALIDNVSEIQWQYRYVDDLSGGGGSSMGSLTAEEAADALGVTDLKSYGQSADQVAALLELLQPDGPSGYTLMKLGKEGEVLAARSLMWADETQLAEDVIAQYGMQSVVRQGADPETLDECYLLLAVYPDGTTTDYYAYLQNGEAVLQEGKEGSCSPLDNALYERLVQLTWEASAWTQTLSAADGADLDACVSEAILSENAGQYPEGDFAAEAHTVLKTEDDGDTTTVYASALYLEFGYSGGAFSEIGGSNMPVALTFQTNAAGNYELTEYWMPKDGTEYAPSIREKFPGDIAEEAIDTQKYVLAQIQDCYRQAIEYGGVDTAARLDKLLETICASPAEASNPGAYRDAHPAEYRELLYYGDYTLRYVFSAFLKGGQTDLRSQIMLAAMRELLGSENLALQTDTAQQWFDAWKEQVLQLKNTYSMDYIQQNDPKAYLLLRLLAAQ